MTIKVSTARFRSTMASVLDAVEGGEVRVITRSGRDAVIIAPLSGKALDGAVKAADNCVRELQETQQERDKLKAAVTVLQNRIETLETELEDAREGASRRRWGRS